MDQFKTIYSSLTCASNFILGQKFVYSKKEELILSFYNDQHGALINFIIFIFCNMLTPTTTTFSLSINVDQTILLR